jgi:uncharacterized protein YyaL (SSP411 family)
MIHALLGAHALTGDARWRDAADEALAGVAELARRAPRFAGWSLAAAQSVVDGAPEIAVVGPEGSARDDLERQARRWPGAVVAVSDGPRDGVLLLAGRDAVAGKPAAYVCRGNVCDRPVVSPGKISTPL